MHRGHDHDHHPRFTASASARIGDNGPRLAQWQTPHLPEAPPKDRPAVEPDVDLVEASFVEGFQAASDPTSFLRLARVPFEAVAGDGAKLALLRVEIDVVADVGAIMPHLGGGSFRYDPLPASAVSRRKRLRFVYFDGKVPRPLTLGEVRGLAEG